MTSDEFVLQLIQRSLEELGYGDVSEQLGREVKSRRTAAGEQRHSDDHDSQMRVIDWFYGELRSGSYQSVDTYLVDVLRRLDDGDGVSTHGVTFTDVLANTHDSKSIVLIILYLVRRTSFLEQLVAQDSAVNMSVLSNYLRDSLMPILDELAREPAAGLAPDDGLGVGLATGGGVGVGDDVGVVDDVGVGVVVGAGAGAGTGAGAVIGTGTLAGTLAGTHTGSGTAGARTGTLTGTLTGSGTAGARTGTLTGVGTPTNVLPTVTSSADDDDKFDFEISAVSKIFGESVLASLNRESESNVLSRLAFSFPFRKSSQDQIIHLVFDPKNLFGYELSNPTSSSVISKLRTLLSDKLLSKIFKLNDKFKTFDTVYEIPKNYLGSLINQSLEYQKLHHPYYLFPRTKAESLIKSPDPHVDDDDLILQGNSRLLHEYYKQNIFPNRLLHVLTHHGSEVWAAKFSPSGKFLATGSLDGKLIIYDVLNNFKVVKILESSDTTDNFAFVPFSAHPTTGKVKAVTYCAWDPSECYLVTCCFDTIIRIWSVGELHNLNANKRITRSMDLSTSTLSTNSDFGLVACFTLGSEIRPSSCEFINNGAQKLQFVVGSTDKVLKAFDIDGDEVFDFYGNVDVSTDSLDSEVFHNVHSSTDEPSTDVTMKDDADEEDAAHGKKQSQKSATSSDAKFPENNFNRINDVSITPNGKILVTASNDSQLHLYSIPEFSNINATTRLLACITLKGKLSSCSISSNGKYLLVSCEADELEVWDISGLYDDHYYEKPILYKRFIGHSQGSYIIRSCFGYLMEESDEEELVLSGSEDGYIYYWKLHTGQLIGRSKGHTGSCNTVDWNNRGKFTEALDYGKLWCSVGDDKEVKIWGI